LLVYIIVSRSAEVHSGLLPQVSKFVLIGDVSFFLSFSLFLLVFPQNNFNNPVSDGITDGMVEWEKSLRQHKMESRLLQEVVAVCGEID
jgi:hypothetical protein